MGLELDAKRLNRFIALVVCAAAASVAISTALSLPVYDHAAMTVVLAAAFAIVQLLPVPLPHGRQLELLGFEEALLVPAVLMMRPSEILIAVVIGGIACHAIERVEIRKALFNIAQLTVAAAAFLIVVNGSVGIEPAFNWQTVLASLFGLLAMFGANQILVAGVLARTGTASPFSKLLLGDIQLRGMMWIANAAVGLLLVPIALNMPYLLAIAIIPLIVLNSSYRAHADRAREEDRLAGLHQHLARIIRDLSIDQVALSLVKSAREVVRADSVELFIHGSSDAYLANNNGEQIIPAAGATQRSDHNRGQSVQISLVGRSGLDATLSVRRHRVRDGLESPFDFRDITLLETLAGQSQTALDNALLFARELAEKKMLEEIFEHSNEGLFMLASSGRVVSWNPAMESITGFAANDVLNSPIGLIAPRLGEIVEVESNGTLEGTIATAEGGRRDVRASYARIGTVDDGGDSEQWVVVLHDITSTREIERLKDDFVATVSHELRTPLTAIIGFIHTLQREDVSFDSRQQQTFLQLMSEQADRLHRLIADLLDISSMGAGRKMTLAVVPVDPALEVETAVTAFCSANPDANILVHPIDTSVLVRADRIRLQQVLTNLLDNAYKHAGSPTSGTEIRVGRRNESVFISVIDHGPGIASSDAANIFERFFYPQSSVTRHGGGVGLGLFICRELMVAMHGDITLESTIGVGSNFTVELPVAHTLAARREYVSSSFNDEQVG